MAREKRLLTKREAEICTCLFLGYTTPQISAKLFTSRRCIEFHLQNIYVKLGVHNRAEATNELRRLLDLQTTVTTQQLEQIPPPPVKAYRGRHLLETR
jgi:DNA-binding CsgD family transcriptional regulator